MNKKKILVALSALVILLAGLFFIRNRNTTPPRQSEVVVREDGHYSSKEEVAAYLLRFGKLPDNYLTKKEAIALGWNPSEGNLWEVSAQASIGGDRFGNREGLLPQVEGRKWYECDIDYRGGHRGGKRIVYSNDGLIYYTEDHYKSFTALKGD